MSFGIPPIPYNQVVTRLVQANCVPESIQPKGACFKMEWEGFQKTIDQTTFKPKNVNVG